jgi:aminoglycoside phosphotransferase
MLSSTPKLPALPLGQRWLSVEHGESGAQVYRSSGAQLLARINNELGQRLAQEANDRVVCHGNACMPNFLMDPDTLRCTGMIDLGRLGTADRYVDLSLFLGNLNRNLRHAIVLITPS